MSEDQNIMYGEVRSSEKLIINWNKRTYHKNEIHEYKNHMSTCALLICVCISFCYVFLFRDAREYCIKLYICVVYVEFYYKGVIKWYIDGFLFLTTILNCSQNWSLLLYQLNEFIYIESDLKIKIVTLTMRFCN